MTNLIFLVQKAVKKYEKEDEILCYNTKIEESINHYNSKLKTKYSPILLRYINKLREVTAMRHSKKTKKILEQNKLKIFRLKKCISKWKDYTRNSSERKLKSVEHYKAKLMKGKYIKIWLLLYKKRKDELLKNRNFNLKNKLLKIVFAWRMYLKLKKESNICLTKKLQSTCIERLRRNIMNKRITRVLTQKSIDYKNLYKKKE